jgi:hypothetical protein
MLHLLMPLIWISIVREVTIPSMSKSRLVSGLEWTPVPLSASSDLDRIGKYSIHIATVETVDLFQEIEIVEEPAIIGDVLWSSDMRYPIERKCDQLVDTQTDIEKNRRDDDTIDKWDRENIADMDPLGRNEVLVERSFFGLVLLREHLEEYDFFLL